MTLLKFHNNKRGCPILIYPFIYLLTISINEKSIRIFIFIVYNFLYRVFKVNNNYRFRFVITPDVENPIKILFVSAVLIVFRIYFSSLSVAVYKIYNLSIH